jgi:hypothetical protein
LRFEPGKKNKTTLKPPFCSRSFDAKTVKEESLKQKKKKALFRVEIRWQKLEARSNHRRKIDQRCLISSSALFFFPLRDRSPRSATVIRLIICLGVYQVKFASKIRRAQALFHDPNTFQGRLLMQTKDRGSVPSFPMQNWGSSLTRS